MKAQENCIVHYTKKKKSIINSRLLDRQNAWDNLELIKSLHMEKYKVFNKMRRSRKPSTLRALAKDVKSIEFKLQAAWNFSQNENYHRWFDVPKCTCPKMDNADMLGTDYNVYSEGCPIHWDDYVNKRV